MTKKTDPVADRDAAIVAGADHFTVVIFAPRGASFKATTDTLDEAMATGIRTVEFLNEGDSPLSGKPAMVYAVRGESQALVGTVRADLSWEEVNRKGGKS